MTPEEKIQRYQEIERRGLLDRLSPEKQQMWAELKRRRGIGQDQQPAEQPQTIAQPAQQDMQASSPRQRRALRARDERDAAVEALTPEERQLMEDISPLEAFRIGVGRGFYTVGRGLGVVDPEEEVVTRGVESLKKVRPTSTGGGELVGETAPFLLPGGAVGRIASTTGRVAATAGLGAAEGNIISRGMGADDDQVAQATGLAGVTAGALEMGLPYIGRIGGNLVRRYFGRRPSGPVVNAAGEPSEELVQAMQATGVEFDELLAEAQRIGPDVDPQQAARFAALESQGLTPTKAQVTRDAADFQAQQEAAKSSGRVRQALEDQEATLTTRFQERIAGTGGDAGQPTNTIVDALQSKASALDQQISNLYKQARQSAPGEKNVRFDALSAQLRRLAPQETASGGRISAIVGELKQRGIMDDKFNIVGRVSVEDAEDIRKIMNDLYDAQNPVGNSALRQMKDALDTDVFKAAGQDVFNQARSAKREFEQELARAKINKFDSRKQNLVRDILENKIDPDRFTDQVVKSKKWRADDLRQLKDYVGTTTDGQAAWSDLRADTLQDIMDSSFIGPEDASGFQALSRDKLEKAINRIGPEKLSVIFEPDEIKFLRNMQAVSRLREPVRGTQQGLGPSAQAIGRVEKLIRDIPFVSALYDMTIDASGRVALKSKPRRIPQTIEGSAVRQGVATGAAAASTAAAAEEDQ